MREHIYTVDINSKLYQIANYKQYDNDIPYNIDVVENGVGVDLEGYTAIAIFKNRIGTVCQKNCTIDGSIVRVILDNNILSVAGTTSVEFRFSIAEKQIRTFTLKLDVQESINLEDAIQSVSRWDIIDDLLNFDTNVVQVKLTEMQSQVDAKLVENDNTVDGLVAQFNALAPDQSANVEVQLARKDVTGKEHASLQERLLADSKGANTLYQSVEGPYISTDSIDGWVKNPQILGNTYQDPNSLAIKSTGNKLSDGRFEIPLLTVGKNLFDGEFTKGYAVNSTTGLVAVQSGWSTTKNYIRCKPSTSYMLSKIAYGYVYYYGFDKTYLGVGTRSDLGTGNKSFTTPSNAYYMLFGVQSETETGIQLEAGTISSSFEQHQSNKLTILSDEPIEKVGTADRIVQLNDGLWYKEKNNITIKLDGTRDWSIKKTFTDYTQFGFLIADALKENNSLKLISDYALPTLAIYDQDVKGLYCHQGTLFLNYLKSKAPTLTDFKNCLNNENILLKYPLATPIYIPLPDAQQVALRTFTNKTNILSLCEIEPTIKCDVPKSIGASVNAITEKVSAIDKDLARVKKLEDATTSTVVTDNSFVNIVDSTNGYLSDIKLEGRTLNQLVTNGNFANTIGWATSGSTISASNNILTVTGTGATSYAGVYRQTGITCNTNKKIFVKATVKLKNSNCTNFKLLVQGSLGGSTTSQITTLNPTIDTSYTVYNIITLDSSFLGNVNVFPVSYYADVATATGKVMEVQNVMALDLTALGMTNYTADQINSMLGGYFEGIKSVGQDVNQIVVSSVCGSGNLFTGNILRGYINTSGVYISQSSALTDIGYTSEDFIRVKKSSIINIKSFTSTGSNTVTVAEYSLDKTYISQQSSVDGKNITLSSNTSFIKVKLNSVGVTDFKKLDLVISANTITNYIEYQTDKKEILYLDTVDSTWKKPTFRGIWSNGALVVGDTTDKHADGKYYYHLIMGETKYIGTEAFVLNDSTTYANTIWFSIPRNLSKASSKVLCDKFNIVIAKGDYEGIFIDATNVYVGISKTKCTDLTTFKTWLTSNNVTIVYELATPLTYECTPIDLASFDSETNYLIESGVLSPRSTIKCQNYIGSIINNLKEQVSVLQNKVYKENITMMTMLLNHEARLIAHSI